MSRKLARDYDLIVVGSGVAGLSGALCAAAEARVLVSGNYQSGISVADFTNPAAAREIAFADPAPLSTANLELGGDWSSYWYNGHIYESDIRRGLIVWGLSDPAVAAAQKLDHLNPQTEEFSIPLAH